MALTKLTTDLIDSTIVTSVNGSTGAVTLETGTDWQSTPKTADFTAVAGEGYFVDTTSAAITVTLPSSPTAGDEINLVDYAGTADTNNITITSTDNINGASNDVKIDYERGGVSMVYVDPTQGWIAYNAANETASALVPDIPLIVDYLVVAGGGGGGTRFGGGGGAGGYRTNYGGTALTLTPSTDYIVTIGSGGAAGAVSGGPGTAGANDGSNGQNSVFSTITSTGGGGGGAGDQRNGLSGGSGGGGAGRFATTGGAGNTPSTSPSQGNDGGDASGAQSGGAYVGAGGGGAGAAGNAGEAGGAGGNGSSNSITGSAQTYAGGGGGGTESGGIVGPGGTGGGGAGGYNTTATSGTPNTGGGGGGGGYTGVSGSENALGGSGGSGVVILRYPNGYTITIGSGLTGTTATDGSDKVTTFTAGTGTISFS